MRAPRSSAYEGRQPLNGIQTYLRWPKSARNYKESHQGGSGTVDLRPPMMIPLKAIALSRACHRVSDHATQGSEAINQRSVECLDGHRGLTVDIGAPLLSPGRVKASYLHMDWQSIDLIILGLCRVSESWNTLSQVVSGSCCSLSRQC